MWWLAEPAVGIPVSPIAGSWHASIQPTFPVLSDTFSTSVPPAGMFPNALVTWTWNLIPSS
jgi:hypothetical protein